MPPVSDVSRKSGKAIQCHLRVEIKEIQSAPDLRKGENVKFLVIGNKVSVIFVNLYSVR